MKELILLAKNKNDSRNFEMPLSRTRFLSSRNFLKPFYLG